MKSDKTKILETTFIPKHYKIWPNLVAKLLWVALIHMRQLCCVLFVVLLLTSCRDKVICPTFQSTYILDDSVRATYFSYLWYLDEDERKSHLSSTAKIPPPDSLGITVASTEGSGGVDYWDYTAQYKVLPRESKRTKYGIVKRTPVIPNLVRNLQLKTSPMENVLTPPDVKKEEENLESADDSTLAPLDSTTITVSNSAMTPLDSTSAINEPDSLSASTPVAEEETKEEKAKKNWVQFKYGFNPLDSMQPDQEFYFKKYGWLLQNAPPLEEPVDSTALLNAALPDSLQSDNTSGKKGLKGLFKRNKNKPKKEKKEKPKEPKNNDAGIPSDEATTPQEENEPIDDSSGN